MEWGRRIENPVSSLFGAFRDSTSYPLVLNALINDPSCHIANVGWVDFEWVLLRC